MRIKNGPNGNLTQVQGGGGPDVKKMQELQISQVGEGLSDKKSFAGQKFKNPGEIGLFWEKIQDNRSDENSWGGGGLLRKTLTQA